MRKLLMVLIMVGMLIGAGSCEDLNCDKKARKKPIPVEPVSVNDTPKWITPDKHGLIWKIGYVPTKAVHEFISGMWNGLCGDEPEKEK